MKRVLSIVIILVALTLAIRFIVARGRVDTVTSRAMKIRELRVPDLSDAAFDPGLYFSSLDFYDDAAPLTSDDKDGMAQFIHLLGYMALSSGSEAWNTSSIPKNGPAYLALRSHFGSQPWWPKLEGESARLSYRQLVVHLMDDYPPHR